jgi:dienelactone hydrolase
MKGRVHYKLCRLLILLGFTVSLNLVVGGGEAAEPQVIFYPSGGLKIQAHLYKPPGDRTFPLVIYNHGSRFPQNERKPFPFKFIGDFLVKAGCAVLVPERRGYGLSDGTTFSEEVAGKFHESIFVDRLQAETDDVLASLDYLKTVPFVDTKRLAVAGWSLGGIITMFAISRSDVFRAAVNQAGAALTWNRSPPIRAALEKASREVNTPVFLVVAENDRTTAPITTLAKIFQDRNHPHQVKIYPPFRSDGHQIFGQEGLNVWGDDFLNFLRRYLGGCTPTQL